jgi:hypothetical protein
LAAAALTGGAYSIKIPANSLTIGSDTLAVSYSGDGTYTTATNSVAITVTPAPLFALTSTPPAAVTRGSAATASITVTGSNGYAGTVALTCVLTNYPVGASDLPSCTGNTVTLSSTVNSATATVSITTTAATASLVRPDFNRNTTSLAGVGVAALALLALFGIPAQRPRWRSLLGMLVLLVALGSLAACSGGGSSSSKVAKDPGTTSGPYTFTVTGSGNPAITPVPTTTFVLTVN